MDSTTDTHFVQFLSSLSTVSLVRFGFSSSVTFWQKWKDCGKTAGWVGVNQIPSALSHSLFHCTNDLSCCRIVHHKFLGKEEDKWICKKYEYVTSLKYRTHLAHLWEHIWLSHWIIGRGRQLIWWMWTLQLRVQTWAGYVIVLWNWIHSRRVFVCQCLFKSRVLECFCAALWHHLSPRLESRRWENPPGLSFLIGMKLYLPPPEISALPPA